MIFVTVGTTRYQFNRLLESMDLIAYKLKEEVIMQIGFSTYIPKYAKWFKFLEDEGDILNLYKQADIIVAHAGVGTILTALRLEKRLIVVPRQKKFGEHIDDHQIELAKALEKLGIPYITVVYDTYHLEDAIQFTREYKAKFRGVQSRNRRLVNFLKEYLQALSVETTDIQGEGRSEE